MSELARLKTESEEARAMRVLMLTVIDEMSRLQRRGLRVNFQITSPAGVPALTAFEVVKVVEL